jgi:hypothetical protein
LRLAWAKKTNKQKKKNKVSKTLYQKTNWQTGCSVTHLNPQLHRGRERCRSVVVHAWPQAKAKNSIKNKPKQKGLET